MTVQTTPQVVQDPKLVELGINVIRGLAMDAPEQAHSGHTGTAMALAPLAHVLWTRIMRYDPLDPKWPDRDRFVLSCGHACILQYAMLHLTGYDLSLEDLRQFRQLGSRTPGHPEVGHTAGLEVTTGPLGQGFANAVGLALAERWLRTTFGSDVCDHRTFVFSSDGCIMEGISHEAASLAGHLGLGRLLAVYDDNHITIDGPTELAYGDDPVGRFEAYGWRVRYLGEMANDVDGLEAAVREALDYPADGPDAKPNLLVLRSHIGWPSPKLTDTAAAHGNPFGEDEIRVTKAILGLPPDQTFWVPDEVREFYGQEVRPRRAGARSLAGPLRRLGRRPRRLGRGAGRPRPARLGRRPPPLRRRQGARHAPRHQPVHQRVAVRPPRPDRRVGRPDGEQRRQDRRRRGARSGLPRRDPGALRNPGARNGRRADRHGAAWRRTPRGRNVLLLLGLHASRCAAGRPHGIARRVRVVARLHRPRRGRPDAPAHRAPGVVAGHARPQPRAPGRRQRDRPGLATRRGGRGTRRLDLDPPGHPGPCRNS